ncbi:MAG: argininosuccinate lyase [Vicinamibacterales bacterium]
MRFAPEFVSCVLNENFEDAKAFFLAPLMAVHYAHLAMLVERDIVGRSEGRALAKALDSVSLPDVRQVQFDGTYEDLFFYVERLIAESAGEDIAGRLHTARSRNDIDMTMYRMRQREMILALIAGSQRLRQVLLNVADRHRATVFAAHTHTQPAQPTTVAHYLMGAVEQLERDGVRLAAAFATTNLCPLGSCAITGTGFPIDRTRTSALLGFAGPTENTYGSIGTVDYLLESISAASVMLVGLGRILQDLLLWCTAEFGYLRLSDAFVQCSSVMPQKRNPVALEHARAIASKAVGQAQAIVVAVHNTPFGDIVDTEDDLQPLVVTMFTDSARAVRLAAAALETAQFDTARMAQRAGECWITITELADTLTRHNNLPFKTSHAIASRLVTEAANKPWELWPALLARISAETHGTAIHYSSDQLAQILSPAHFVEVRTTRGGPNPDVVAQAIQVSRERLANDQGWFEERMASLKRAEDDLKSAIACLASY